MTYTVYVNGEKISFEAIKHWHGDEIDAGHKHLMGEEAQYVDWVWSAMNQKGDHYHRLEEAADAAN